jgi:PAS domain S-box-containing protein
MSHTPPKSSDDLTPITQDPARMASFPEDNPNPVLEISLDCRVTYLNPAARSLFPDIEDKEVDHPFLAGLPGMLERAAKEPGFQLSREVKVGLRYYQQSINYVHKYRCLRMYAVDVTDSKSIELERLQLLDNLQQAVRQEEGFRSQFEAIFASQIDAVLFYNNKMQVARANPSFVENYGFVPVGMTIQEIIQRVSCRWLDGRPLLLNEQPTPRALRGEKVVGARFLVKRSDGTDAVVETSSGPVLVGDQITGSVTVWHDVTQSIKVEDELRKLNRNLRALSDSNQVMMRAASESKLMEEVCRIIIQDCGYAMTWIGIAEQDEAKTVLPVAYSGFEEGYLETLKLTWSDSERGRGPTGTAIRTGKACICRNMLTDPNFLPWRAEAKKRGYASSIALPMLEGDKSFGALTIYSKEPDPFTPQEVKLLTELTSDLAYGIASIRIRAAHTQAEEELRRSEEHYRSLFNGMTEGFALHEIVCDEYDQPIDYRFLEINPSFERLTGLKRELVLGRLHNEILPDDGTNWVKIYGNVALTGEPVHFENFSPALKQYYEVFAYRPAPRQFAVIFMNVTARKQSEEMLRQRSQELETARQEAEVEKRRLQAVMDALPVGIAITDARGGNIHSNRAFEQIWGGPTPQTLSISDYTSFKAWWADTGKPVEPEEWASALVVQKGKPVVGQLIEIQRFDGSHAYVINSASPVYDSAGNIAGSAVAVQDVTSLRQAEQALAEVNALLEQRVLERTEDLQTLNEELKVEIEERRHAEEIIRQQAARSETLAELSRSLAAAQLELKAVYDITTRSVAEHIGDTCGIFLLSEDEQWLMPVALYNQDSELQERLYKAVSAMPLHVGEDIPEGFIRAGEAVFVSSTTPQELAAMTGPGYTPVINEYKVSHALIAPLRQNARTIGALALIRSQGSLPYTRDDRELLELLADRAALSITKARLYQDLQLALQREQQTRLQLIQAEKNSALARMVASIAHEINNPIQTIKNCMFLLKGDVDAESGANDILEMASSEANRIGDLVARLRELYKPSKELSPKPFDVLEVLNNVHSLLMPHLQHHNVSWSIQSDTDCTLVNGIADQLKQVFLNICLNAIDAMEQGEGSLTVDVTTSTPDQVFISFKDSGKGIHPEDMPHIFEPFYTTKEKGTGLGLSICYEIVKNFNGNITVVSQPERGSEFVVRLPAERC